MEVLVCEFACSDKYLEQKISKLLFLNLPLIKKFALLLVILSAIAVCASV